MPDVEHDTLSGADLHEPKGIAGASANETYVADGAGSGSWSEPEPKGASTASVNETYVSDGAGSGSWSEPEPKGATGANDQEVYVADGAGSGAWTPQTYVITAVIPDIGTAKLRYVAVPFACRVTKVTTVLQGTISGADETITVRNHAGTSMGTLTIAQSGSAAGDVDTIGPGTNNTFTVDQTIQLETNGDCTGAVDLIVSILVERTG